MKKGTGLLFIVNDLLFFKFSAFALNGVPQLFVCAIAYNGPAIHKVLRPPSWKERSDNGATVCVHFYRRSCDSLNDGKSEKHPAYRAGKFGASPSEALRAPLLTCVGGL